MEELNKNNPFKTPEGYFENFSDALEDKLSIDKLNLSKEDGFTIPENYFDTLHGKILDKIDAGETKVIPLNPYKKYYYAAASIAAVFILGFVLNMNTNEAPSFDTVASTDIEDYFDNYVYDFNDDELAELLSMQAVSVNDVLNTEINQEEIVDYLDSQIENHPELNNIYNEE